MSLWLGTGVKEGLTGVGPTHTDFCVSRCLLADVTEAEHITPLDMPMSAFLSQAVGWYLRNPQ